ncbi:MAG: hypothetical protein ACRDAU_12410 [Clostridium sp.]
MENIKVLKEKHDIRKIFFIVIFVSIIAVPLVSTLNYSINKMSTTNALQILEGKPSGITMDINDSSSSGINNIANYLNEYKSGSEYLIDTSLEQVANTILFGSSKAFLALGGYSGTSRILILGKFRETLKKKVSRVNQEQILIISHEQNRK